MISVLERKFLSGPYLSCAPPLFFVALTMLCFLFVPASLKFTGLVLIAWALWTLHGVLPLAEAFAGKSAGRDPGTLPLRLLTTLRRGRDRAALSALPFMDAKLLLILAAVISAGALYFIVRPDFDPYRISAMHALARLMICTLAGWQIYKTALQRRAENKILFAFLCVLFAFSWFYAVAAGLASPLASGKHFPQHGGLLYIPFIVAGLDFASAAGSRDRARKWAAGGGLTVLCLLIAGVWFPVPPPESALALIFSGTCLLAFLYGFIRGGGVRRYRLYQH